MYTVSVGYYFFGRIKRVDPTKQPPHVSRRRPEIWRF
nr:MAG TPA: hypothetical protein [Caudoviricetes sp.]